MDKLRWGVSVKRKNKIRCEGVERKRMDKLRWGVSVKRMNKIRCEAMERKRIVTV